jgi:hypothetical protein
MSPPITGSSGFRTTPSATSAAKAATPSSRPAQEHRYQTQQAGDHTARIGAGARYLEAG